MKFEIYNKKTGEVVLDGDISDWLVIGGGKITYKDDEWPMEDYGVHFGWRK